MNDTAECKNTDRELWRSPDDGRGSYYADSIHVTEGGGIGIDVGGHVIVKPLRDWHAMAVRPPTVNDPRWCDYCQSWHGNPCGEGCVWLPTNPTVEQMRATDLKERRAHNRKHPLPVTFAR